MEFCAGNPVVEWHVVLLPFMAHGHLIPFLSLARALRRRHPNLFVTIAATPLNVCYLRSVMSPSKDGLGIRLAQLSYCSSDHGLPPDAENTENLSLERIEVLFRSSVNLRGPLERLISEIAAADGRKPVCIISDVVFGWSVEVARTHGIKCITFTTDGISELTRPITNKATIWGVKRGLYPIAKSKNG